MLPIRVGQYLAPLLFIGWVGLIPAARAAAGEGSLEKAILYEEMTKSAGDSSTAGKAVDGSVAWRFIENGADGPAIEADLQIPERKLKVKLIVHKNLDQSLPASHLIEIRVDARERRISEVRGIIMKETEQAAGAPLAGLAAKVTSQLFWIALSASPEDLGLNLALLRKRDWIDMPFVYEDGQRAILTFEKGAAGDKVLRAALAAWEGSSGTAAPPPAAADIDQLQPTISVPKPAQ